MAVEKKPVMVHYRKFTREDGAPTATLEALVRQAMGTAVDGVQLRNSYSLRVRPAGDHHFFVNTYVDQSGDGTPLVFGDVIHFTKGHLQALFKVSGEVAPSAAVQQMPAPALSEYVHSQMFWMVKGDHVFIIQSISLRTEHLEEYLTWLLSVKTPTTSALFPVTLAFKFDMEMVGGDLDDIQEIVIGGIAATTPETAPSLVPVPGRGADSRDIEREIIQDNDIGATRQTGWSQARDILRALLGGEASVNQFMAAVPADADLRVAVHIGYKTRKKQVSRTALRQLETGLRNLPDSQLLVKSKGASRSVDGSLRLHYSAGVNLIKARDGDLETIGSLLDPTDCLRAMLEAYNVFLANGKILT